MASLFIALRLLTCRFFQSEDDDEEDDALEAEAAMPVAAVDDEAPEAEQDDEELAQDSVAVEVGSVPVIRTDAGDLLVVVESTPGSKLEGSADNIRLHYDPSAASCASKSGRAAPTSTDRKRRSEDELQSGPQKKAARNDGCAEGSSFLTPAPHIGESRFRGLTI